MKNLKKERKIKTRLRRMRVNKKPTKVVSRYVRPSGGGGTLILLHGALDPGATGRSEEREADGRLGSGANLPTTQARWLTLPLRALTHTHARLHAKATFSPGWQPGTFYSLVTDRSVCHQVIGWDNPFWIQVHQHFTICRFNIHQNFSHTLAP